MTHTSSYACPYMCGSGAPARARGPRPARRARAGMGAMHMGRCQGRRRFQFAGLGPVAHMHRYPDIMSDPRMCRVCSNAVLALRMRNRPGPCVLPHVAMLLRWPGDMGAGVPVHAGGELQAPARMARPGFPGAPLS